MLINYNFFLCHGCIYKHASSENHTQNCNKDLWPTQSATPCWYWTRYILRSSLVIYLCNLVSFNLYHTQNGTLESHRIVVKSVPPNIRFSTTLHGQLFFFVSNEYEI
ncbi:hypothetical protein SFRURICE_001047 [Spodoptera frugiperda]|nr:hypothetical protein SFRURICE_001047 [Spodoptera frugiperda]